MSKIDISITKNIWGALVLSTIHNGYYCERAYTGYTRKEAKALFLDYLKTR